MSIRFEILINGERFCVAGHEGFGVLSAMVTWAQRNPDQFASSGSAMTRDEFAAQELHLQVGGLDTNGPIPRDLGWIDRVGPKPVKAGDEITIRILEPGPFDAPCYVSPGDRGA